MSTELSNGVIIPEEYSDDWYDEMSINLRKLNDVITAASDNATDIQRLDTDKANQSDLTALTSRVNQNETDIIALQTAVSGALKREIVQTLPTEDISTTTIYMIRNSESSGTNIYDEYMYINSQWELIGTSATDFGNYYTKNETDNLLSGKVDNSTLGSYYTKTESDNLLSAKANQTDLTSLSGRVTQNETDITALQTAVSGALKREIVQSLPTQDISTTTIYMIRNTTTSGDNIYDEYMYINNLWELIGTSATDFSNYYTKTEIDTQLSGKANDSDVVHKSGKETVGGIKTFSETPYIYNSDSTGNTPNIVFKNSKYVVGDTTNTGEQRIIYADKNNAWSGSISCNKNVAGTQYLAFVIYTTDNNNANLSSTINYYLTKNGDRFFTPYEDNLINLGVNGRRWKSVYATNYYYGSNNVEFSTKFVTTDTNQTITGNKTFSSINGVEPSSLSLPSDRSARIDISSYFSNTGTGDTNSYTAPANGWIYLRLGDLSGCQATVLDANNNRMWGQSVTGNVEQITIPILKGQTLSTQWATGSSVYVAIARFIPCQGNI